MTASKGKVIIWNPKENVDSDLQKKNSKRGLKSVLRWKVEQTIEIKDYEFTCASWNMHGTRILFGGDNTMLWETKNNVCLFRVILLWIPLIYKF